MLRIKARILFFVKSTEDIALVFSKSNRSNTFILFFYNCGYVGQFTF